MTSDEFFFTSAVTATGVIFIIGLSKIVAWIIF